MVQLEAKKVSGNIVISESSFEHLLNCLDNQKFAGEVNADGMAMDSKDRRQLQTDIQEAIDNFNRQCRGVLHGD